jgi:hypothetical protein
MPNSRHNLTNKADHVITMQVAASGPKYRDNSAASRFYQEIGNSIMRLTGVTDQGAVSVLPMTGTVGWGGINVEGYTPPPGQELQVDMRLANTGYFRMMTIPLLKGRFFSDRDNADSEQVAIIDQKFAERFWQRENPIGKHLFFDLKKPFTITGVIGSVKQYGLDMDSKIVVYFAHVEMPSGGMFLVARTSGDTATLAGPIVREIHTVDPGVAVYGMRKMDNIVHDSLARQRFAITMLSAFPGFALHASRGRDLWRDVIPREPRCARHR